GSVGPLLCAFATLLASKGNDADDGRPATVDKFIVFSLERRQTFFGNVYFFVHQFLFIERRPSRP
ncbi:MAG: hypothetical protein WD628_02690, partial [Thermomicrobiales bacterium]